MEHYLHIIDKNTYESIGSILTNHGFTLDEALEFCGYSVENDGYSPECGRIINRYGQYTEWWYDDLRLHSEPKNMEKLAEWLWDDLGYTESDLEEIAEEIDLIPWEVEFIRKRFRRFKRQHRIPVLQRYNNQ